MPALKGEKKNVVDVDIPFEETSTCDLVINTENKEPIDIVNEIIKDLELKRNKMCGIFGGCGISVDESRKAIELIKRGDDGITISKLNENITFAARRH